MWAKIENGTWACFEPKPSDAGTFFLFFKEPSLLIAQFDTPTVRARAQRDKPIKPFAPHACRTNE